jgi:poly(3-hydroxyoctanoate) depolymerase
MQLNAFEKDSTRPMPQTGRREMLLSQVKVYGRSIRVAVWPGNASKTPLLLLNGIGASFELLVPFADALGDIEVIAFDAPGAGESEVTLLPYRLWMLSMLASGVLNKLDYSQIDVLGVSWGGALAQQFALQNPRRCRRLILAATSQGVLMVPPRPSVLAKFVTTRRFNDANYRRAIAGKIYGGKARTSSLPVEEFRKTSSRGYIYQQLALMGWTSLPWLPLLPQKTLILAGDDDPVIPLANARIMASLIRNCELHVIKDGHLFLISSAEQSAKIVMAFLESDERGHHEKT